MKWALWILGGLVVVVGLMAMVGAMLPLRHHASRKARFKASPEAPGEASTACCFARSWRCRPG